MCSRIALLEGERERENAQNGLDDTQDDNLSGEQSVISCRLQQCTRRLLPNLRRPPAERWLRDRLFMVKFVEETKSERQQTEGSTADWIGEDWLFERSIESGREEGGRGS